METFDMDSITHDTQEKESYWRTATTKLMFQALLKVTWISFWKSSPIETVWIAAKR